MPHNREQQKRAGRKGGTTTKARHGPGYFSSIGKKGGQAVKEQHGAAHFKEAGRRGGEAMAKQPEVLRRAAARGGKATLEKLGKEHFQRIGAAAAASRAARQALLPALLAALEPFQRYLEETEAAYFVVAKDMPHPSSCGVTFGDCLTLLKQMRLARGEPAKDPATQPERLLGFKVKINESNTARELTFVPDEGALPAGGTE